MGWLKPHIITIDDSHLVHWNTILASDDHRGKKMVAVHRVVKVDTGWGSYHRLQCVINVIDTHLPEGKQIVLVTWNLDDAVAKYNELG